MKYWLFKTEPDVFSIDDLIREKLSYWEGVRNYQARNYLRDEVKLGDLVLFYHSRLEPPGVVGIAEVAKEASPDPFQFDPNHKYFDPKLKGTEPRWFGVHLKPRTKFQELIPLDLLKKTKGLEKMVVTQKGSRLSIQPVTKKEFEIVIKLAGVTIK
ncbi:EVE domain-containing protein [Leptospira yanagawae]|uniref:EVE domain-containing protein n=1 Tax=Leptospira yanagawae TaxID=293069 RepID=A0ABY2M5D6_9LEPT|nr:EVE domain-containing protein [Leptospira yanagawae]TGL24292.1 EVE domain-containing protein [Leptospira yanagawae]